MRRADRLFQIIQLLRSRRRAVTAKWLAEQLSVSERTVYRDVRDLMASGTPIEGEAGVGYQLRREYDLPPLMFDAEEMEALVLGARLVSAFGDESLVQKARSAISKIESVLPQRVSGSRERPPLYAPRGWAARAVDEPLRSVRAALTAKRKLRVHYENAEGVASVRTVRPLGAFFWGRSWTLTAWCELRNDFRNFRLDRMQAIELSEEPFVDEPDRTLKDYLRVYGEAAERLLEE